MNPMGCTAAETASIPSTMKDMKARLDNSFHARKAPTSCDEMCWEHVP